MRAAASRATNTPACCQHHHHNHHHHSSRPQLARGGMAAAPSGDRTSWGLNRLLPAWCSGQRGSAAVQARAGTAAATSSRPPPTHLIVLVNGLFGGPSNWDVLCEALSQALPPDTLLHASQVNSRFATYEGIDTNGQRLANEVRGLVAATPSLTRVSVIAHSMGGLIARYALGCLFNPATRTVAGLRPCHFVAMATPHCGCDVDGVAQVPFIGWSSSLPLLGQQLYRLLSGISDSTASILFQRTGQQFFCLDGAPPGSSTSSLGTASLPLLLQLSQDCEDRGLHFYSALAAFRTRTALANMDGDHLVGHSNASLRSLEQLPPPPAAAARAKGVVLEDSLSAAFWPTAWQELQRSWAAAAAGNGGSSSARSDAAAAVQQPYAASRIFSSSSSSAISTWQELTGNGGGVVAQQQQQQQQGKPVVDSADELVQLARPPAAGEPQQQPSMMLTAGAAAAATAAAERDLTSGLSSGGAAVASSAAAAAADVAADARSSRLSRAEVVARILQRLQELPWRRIDVSFQGARFGLAHNNIQVTRRWWNFEGQGVPAHLAQQLRLVDEVLMGPPAQ